MQNKRQIFVTGASSALMQRFIPKIDTDRFDVVCLTREIGNKTKDLNWVEGDIRNPDQMSRLMQECRIVVHAAAVTHSQEQKDYFDINLRATEQLVEIAARNSVEKFIYISSRSAVEGSGAYGLSKMMAEKCVADNLSNWTIFRLSEVFGTQSDKDFISKIIYSTARQRVVVCPVNMPSKLFPIHLDDAANIMHDLSFNHNFQNRIIAINGNEGYSLYELIQTVARCCNENVIIMPIPKWVMKSVEAIIQYIPIDIGVTADQISRLYCVKQDQIMNYDMKSFREYVRDVCARL